MIRVLALIAYPFGMAVGQVLFKLAARDLSRLEAASTDRLARALFFNPWFIIAILLYAALSVEWVWILGGMKLSTAYPFVALSFVLTPLLGYFVFGEAVGWSHAAGLSLIVAGILVIFAVK